jgi:hypothetical protein
MEFGPVVFASLRDGFIQGCIDWAQSHGAPGRYGFVEKSDGWYFVVNDQCRYLSKRNLCLREDNKPMPCVDYKCRKVRVE